ncbi:MAG TPA: hypothetical protein VH234_06220 [Candidatus Saccharimonadales bacterium]|jgi:hypothetical protein|nr:hypothetical protein [Candidatus Saccharimonadales bacterium]
MSIFNVLSRIRHDGTVYEAGETLVEIGEEAAQALLVAGAIAKADAADVENQVKEDANTVENQVKDDVAKAEEAVKTEQANKQSLGSKLKSAVTGGGNAPDVTPPAAPAAPAEPAAPVAGQPTPEQVAAAANQVQ